MYQKTISILLAAALLCSLILSGCGNQAAAQPSEENTAAAETVQQEHTAAVETTQPETPTDAEEGAAAVAPQAAPVPAEGQIAEGERPDDLLYPVLDQFMEAEVPEGSAVTDAEVQELDRAIRDYTPSARHSYESYPVNRASSYVFYTLLTSLEQDIYDACLMVAQDPYAEDFRIRVDSCIKPGTPEFKVTFKRAFKSLLADHPELFFLDADLVDIHYRYNDSGSGPYPIYIYMPPVSRQIENMIISFNRNTNAYLALVDDYSSQTAMAKDVHDLLIHNATYDDDAPGHSDTHPLSYCAYGAIVKNDFGQSFTAVCSGYSRAYLYLMQMLCSVKGACISGYTSDPSEGRRHQWNLMELDGRWKEIDATWDDVESIGPDDSRFEYYTHLYFCLSTSEMNRTGGQTGSCRQRYTSRNSEYPFDALMEYLPIAY